MTRVVVISAGLSEVSTTRKLADRLAAEVRASVAGASVEVIDLRPLAHEITDAVLTGFAPPRLQHVIDQVGAADALVAVSPVYQASYSGLFKSFVDVLDAEALVGTPVLVAASGGTARHSLVVDTAMRPLFAYLQALVLPTGVFASPHDWGSEGETSLDRRIARAVGELAAILAGAGRVREPADDIDLFSDTMLSISRPQG